MRRSAAAAVAAMENVKWKMAKVRRRRGKIPMAKSQIPMNVQIPNPNGERLSGDFLELLDEAVGWALVIENWDFIGIWDLDIGISNGGSWSTNSTLPQERLSSLLFSNGNYV